MKTTMESTFPLQAAIDWCMPQRNQSELNAILTDYQRLKALAPDPKQPMTPDPDKAAAMKARALHANTAKVNDLHAAIDAAVELYRLQLVNWTGSDTSRACWLAKRVYPNGKKDKARRPCGWRTIYNYLKTMSL